MIAPTARQLEVLRFISDTLAARGYAPSWADIQAHFNIKSKAAVGKHLVSLEKKGFIHRPITRCRAIQVLRPAPEYA